MDVKSFEILYPVSNIRHPTNKNNDSTQNHRRASVDEAKRAAGFQNFGNAGKRN